MRIEWDEGKNAANQRKHNVSFQQARALLQDDGDDILVIFDEAHSGEEDRFISIGPVPPSILLVVWTERSNDVIRIISARWASPHERDLYFAHLNGKP